MRTGSFSYRTRELKYGIADNFFTRFKGLMFKKSMPQDYGLWIVKCNQIHTFNMRFPIDVVYLDKNRCVVHIDYNVKPNKICRIQKKAYSVLELNAGACADYGFETGVILSLDAY